MKVITASDSRANLAHAFDAADYDAERLAVTRIGRPVYRLTPARRHHGDTGG